MTMQDDTDTNELHPLQDFPAVPTAVWEAAIQRDLNGADYETTLVWRGSEGIAVRPYYRHDVLASAISVAGVPREHAGWEIVASDALEEGPPRCSVRADLVLEAGGNAVQQLGVALAQGVELLAEISEDDSADASRPPMRFVFAVGPDYFLEIAKLRAARLLWTCAVKEFHPAAGEVFRMHLHARTALPRDSERNMLRATTQAMSAVIGGCDSLAIEPVGFARQLAVNIQHILAEEAHLGIVADPGAGSYYIEALTTSLAREAWKLFQRIEAAGGYTASRNDGWLAGEIDHSRGEREGGAGYHQGQAR
jgi:methylmalonyl-CoA mutase